jgi:hypothetical protein
LQRCGVEEILHEVLMKHRLGGSPRAGVSLFPGYRHGDHPLLSSLTAKLRASVSRLLAHQVATAAIITQVPPAVVARLVGVSISAAAQWHYLGASTAEHR